MRTDEEDRLFRGQLSSGLVWLGILAAALSAVNALNTLLDFGISGFWSDILEYYSSLVEPLRKLISRVPLPFDLPSWSTDIFILYIVLVVSGMRATLMPLRTPSYFSNENIIGAQEKWFPKAGWRDAKHFIDTQEYMPRDDISSVTPDEKGYKVVSLMRERPASTVAKRLVKCFLLWPILTFEPFRSRYFSIKDLLAARKAANSSELFVKLPSVTGSRLLNKERLYIDYMKMEGALQIIALPAVVFMFVFCGAYLP